MATIVLLAVPQYAHAGILRITATSFTRNIWPDKNFIIIDDPWFDLAPVGSYRRFSLAEVGDFRFSTSVLVYDPTTIDYGISDSELKLYKSGANNFSIFTDSYISLYRPSSGGGIGGCSLHSDECLQLTFHPGAFPVLGFIKEASASAGSIGRYNVTWNASFTPGTLPPTNVAEPSALLLLSLGLAGLGLLCVSARRTRIPVHKAEWRHT